ncbi:type IV pilus assembly protein PilY1 [Halopseudomonas sabulinigri]|uniref:Type IV pilus assembly protein PilY1 n=1 Tax=Halopseudomonas sabulinigri TaxID=472181 RepID=A0A1H1R1U1_9GAMM|nr:PilC/PilY family type IV pilus protein [Halopseudomonas sabulinigri]SDS29761.1 type IV pilus assembly protein PilY1 [Halopseudomonas sabulinigri]
MRNLFRVFARSGTSTFIASLLLASASAHAAVDIDQQPLLVAKPVPGNMAIIGSFEFPTMVTRAYKAAYSTSGEYVGYFDSAKCYKYNYNNNEANRYFYPVRIGSNCNQADEWSGHYLNWSTMQSIDIFRHILTGGYRQVDTPTMTVLEKGVQTGQGGSANNFPDANISSNVARSTPTTWGAFNTRIGIANTRMGNKMRFSRTGNLNNTPTAYNPAVHGYGGSKSFSDATVYEVSVRVQVCTSALPELNCVDYDQGKKPEGLIQANSDNMRYSAFGYINDNSGGTSNRNSEGGIMHARMKYVGPYAINDNNNEEANAHAEWNENTGVFINNPDPTDASSTPYGNTPVVNSGVISYINKSGLIVPNTLFKRYDNVSELYYTAYRYIKGLSNRSEYISLNATGDSLDRLVGGLPIIDWQATEADDPLQFSCQKNFFLGIGDTNTHNDDRVHKSDDPLAETDFDLLRAQMSSQEGGINVTGAGTGTDRISVLAYDANTSDLRPNMEGKQSVSTYWIDILESGLKGRRNNPYWLAAKYGGLEVPEDFDPYDIPANMPNSWWHTTGETLSNNDLRPDNFYVVASAQDMVDGLVRAFSDIQQEQTGNRSSLALNSTTLEAGSASFQAVYTSGQWTGDLNAFTIDSTTGSLNPTPAWTASSKLPAPANRVIKTWNGSSFANFTYNGLNSTALRDALKNNSGDSPADIIQYLRGVRTLENNSTGFRVRQGVLGDIVDSQPVYVGKPSSTLYAGRSFTGASSYTSWAAALNRTPVVYVGGNDGMLHGFNATTGDTLSGVETFAYVPKRVIENGMGELASPSYDHRYFVDGELTVADAYDGSNWRTVLVGTLGYGGVAKDRSTTSNALFALDVTDPANVTFLWEKSSTDIPQLGNNIGKPVIAQIANGNWSVMIGNGPNSSSGVASLISINVFTGAVTTTAMSTAVDNGLSAIRAWDQDGDGITDTAYAGDLQGNLWKVTGLANTPRTVTQLFQATDPSGVAQPITATPLAGRSPYSQEVWLFFGTGRYVNTDDLADMQVQTWYGYTDNDSGTTATRSDMLEREILLDVAVSSEVSARVIEQGAREDLVGKQGWFIDLYQVASDGSKSALGERMITQNQFQGSALIGNTRIPDSSDPCAPSGRGVIMSIDPFTGARLADTYFDLNGDGDFTDADKVQINGVWTVVSGIGLNTGFSNPSFLDSKMYIPTDDGAIRDLDIKPFSAGAGRTSWRELINLGN